MRQRDRRSGIFSERETENSDARRARHWTELSTLLDQAWTNSSEVRSRLEQAGLSPSDVRSIEDWARIPPLSKKQLLAFQQDQGLGAMLSGDVGSLRRIYLSPGPIFDPEARKHDYWGWTEAFYAAGFRTGDVVQMTFSYHLTPAGLMLEEPLRELGCAVIPAGPGNTNVQIDLLKSLPVTGFVGMASYLKIIKDQALSQGLDLERDFSLQVAFVAAERLPESLRRELEAELGLRVRQGYGTADLGCAAYECPELTGMHLSTRCHVEIVDPTTGQPVEPGEIGEVVVTPFCQEYPLLRLGTGDLSRLCLDSCPCGRSTPRLAGILGRVDNTAKVKGQFVYPHQAAEVLAGFPVVRRWQIVVDNPEGKDALRLRLCLDGTLDRDGLVKRFQEHCKLRPVLVIEKDVQAIAEDAPALVDIRRFD